MTKKEKDNIYKQIYELEKEVKDWKKELQEIQRKVESNEFHIEYIKENMLKELGKPTKKGE
ncbi:MAG: hypothetical protein Q8P81_02060 [Nanoarchaeota archaeon]|nr:hypothetical protein [Nanoarchaeota archaeon]